MQLYSDIQWFRDYRVVNTDIFVIVTQLGPVTPTLIQANHTSGVGQYEGVNFTMISTSMSLGCHVEVSQMQSLLVIYQ